jgi:YHS domain-containing protein
MISPRSVLMAWSASALLVLLGIACSDPAKPVEVARVGEVAKPGAMAAGGAPTAAASQPVAAFFPAAPAVGTTARCPVSGETFTVAAGSERSEYKGQHVAFCCPECKPRFDADPAKFARQ